MEQIDWDWEELKKEERLWEWHDELLAPDVIVTCDQHNLHPELIIRRSNGDCRTLLIDECKDSKAIRQFIDWIIKCDGREVFVESVKRHRESLIKRAIAAVDDCRKTCSPKPQIRHIKTSSEQGWWERFRRWINKFRDRLHYEWPEIEVAKSGAEYELTLWFGREPHYTQRFVRCESIRDQVNQFLDNAFQLCGDSRLAPLKENRDRLVSDTMSKLR